jgi:hypothetical protein
MRVFPAVIVAFLLAGCSGAVSSPTTDTREAQLGIACEGTTHITGNFVLGAAQPADMPGCWPVGTWTFQSTVATNSCALDPQMDPQYQFQVTADAEENQSLQSLSLAHPDAVLRVTAGGGAVCEGQFLYYSPDGKTVINLKPHLFADLSLEGTGQFAEYFTDQRP